MKKTFEIRELIEKDYLVVRDIYEDAIYSLAPLFYTKSQVEAWSSLARLPGVLDKILIGGKGWVSCSKKDIEAFAVRYPNNRLALLYCRGRSARKGHATALLKKIEIDAIKDSQIHLFTEASFCSYPLLIKSGWNFQSLERIKIGGILFERNLMKKDLI